MPSTPQQAFVETHCYCLATIISISMDELMQVPGGYQDSLSSNTELGRAVKSACDELETLGDMVHLSSRSQC